MAIAATTAAPVKIGRVRSWIVNSGPVLGIFAAIFVLWELGCWLFKVPDFILPSPSVIIEKIISSWWLLLVNGMVTAQEIVLGFGMSVAIGIPLAVLAVYSRIFERVAFPFMVSLQTFPKVRLPKALPSIFGGLKVGMGQAVVGATVGEFIAAEQGLGYLQLISQVRLDTALLFAAVVVLSLLGVLLFNLVAWVERLALPWNRMRTEMIE